MREIILEKRYPHSREEDITDAFMRGYQQGCEDGYKKKEFDRDGDCFGCKYIGLRYIEGATPRCEGCCRNYADGYVAEQIEPNSSEKPNNSDEPQERSCDNCNQKYCFACLCHRYYYYYWEPKDEPQTDLLVKTPRKSRESHEKNCETCRDKDAYDEWQGNCDECENGSMYTPQTESLEQFRVGLEYHTDTTHFGKVKGESITTNKVEDEPQRGLIACPIQEETAEYYEWLYEKSKEPSTSKS